jgi:hypothetical protein
MNPDTDPSQDEQPALPTSHQENVPTLKNVSIVKSKPFVASLVGIVLLTVLTVVLVSPIIGFFVICLGIAGYVMFFSGDLFENFAKSNNYSFMPQGFVVNQTGLIFTIGYGPEFSDIVYGTYKDWPFGLFVYSYSIGDQEDGRRYARTVLEIDFTTALPAFVLRKHKLLQILEEEGESLQSHGYTEKVELEGDFDSYFQVFIRPDSQIEVLTILTPDVMELVMKLDRYEIELTEDGKLYVYFHSVAKRKEELENTYKIVGTLVPKIQAYIDRQASIEGSEARVA